jgi:hypothetical protein
MDMTNATIPITVLTKTIKKYAQHSTSPSEKHVLYTLTENLGGEIRAIVPGFNETEFLNQCGVKPEWATTAA